MLNFFYINAIVYRELVVASKQYIFVKYNFLYIFKKEKNSFKQNICQIFCYLDKFN